MKKVNIKGSGYLYAETDDSYILYFDPNDCGWNEHVKGKIAYQVIDTGNGLLISQEKPNELNYSEVAELKYLLNKIKI